MFFQLYLLKNWEYWTICQLATSDDHRPCIDLGLPSCVIIIHSVKRQQSVETVCDVTQYSPRGLLAEKTRIDPLQVLEPNSYSSDLLQAHDHMTSVSTIFASRKSIDFSRDRTRSRRAYEAGT
ncbi:hypothetical protein TNCV_4205501 [Trichonephila clavipes]|nr:hypothetical protein TNCV_4205501 [Trichonephila clavipes]